MRKKKRRKVHSCIVASRENLSTIQFRAKLIRSFFFSLFLSNFRFEFHGPKSNCEKKNLPFAWVKMVPNSRGWTEGWPTKRWSVCERQRRPTTTADLAPDTVPRLGRPTIPICDLRKRKCINYLLHLISNKVKHTHTHTIAERVYYPSRVFVCVRERCIYENPRRDWPWLYLHNQRISHCVTDGRGIR